MVLSLNFVKYVTVNLVENSLLIYRYSNSNSYFRAHKNKKNLKLWNFFFDLLVYSLPLPSCSSRERLITKKKVKKKESNLKKYWSVFFFFLAINVLFSLLLLFFLFPVFVCSFKPSKKVFKTEQDYDDEDNGDDNDDVDESGQNQEEKKKEPSLFIILNVFFSFHFPET